MVRLRSESIVPTPKDIFVDMTVVTQKEVGLSQTLQSMMLSFWSLESWFQVNFGGGRGRSRVGSGPGSGPDSEGLVRVGVWGREGSSPSGDPDCPPNRVNPGVQGLVVR